MPDFSEPWSDALSFFSFAGNSSSRLNCTAVMLSSEPDLLRGALGAVDKWLRFMFVCFVSIARNAGTRAGANGPKTAGLTFLKKREM